MNSARHDILAGVRRSLGVTGDEATRRQAVADRIAHPSRGIIPARGQKDGADAVATFKRFAEGVQATVAIVSRPEDVPAEVARWLDAANLPATLRMGADPRLAIMPWATIAPECTIGPSDGSDLNGVSHAFAGVIETGSLVLLSGPENPTTLNFLPDNHIVVLDAADLLASLEGVWTRLRAQSRNGALPRSINMVTGPSRSGDIDRTIFLGAHGPRALHIIIVSAPTQDVGVTGGPAQS